MNLNRALITVLTLAGILAMPVKAELNYLRLYMVGQATPAGWNENLPEEMTPIGNDCFLWDGYLQEGDFKFLNTRGDWNSSLVASEYNQPLNPGEKLELRFNESQSYPDHKFYNSQAGWVRVIVNLRDMNVNFRRPVLGLVGEAALGWSLGKNVIPVFADDEGRAVWSGQLRRGELKILAGNCDDWSPCYNAPEAGDRLSDGGHAMIYNGEGDFKYEVPVSGFYTLTFKNEGSEYFYGVDVTTREAPALDGRFVGMPGRYLVAVDRQARRVHTARVPGSLYIGTSGGDCVEIGRVADGKFSGEVSLRRGAYYKLSTDPSDWENRALSSNADVDITSSATANVAPMHGFSYTVPSDGNYLVSADFTGNVPSLYAVKQTASEVSPIEAADRYVSVNAADGVITVEGEYTSLAICDMAGRLVGCASPCNVSQGIYLVKADNKVFKISIR